MTYDSDPPRMRLSGDPSDPLVQALEEARLELPSAEQLKAVADRLAPLAASGPSFASVARTRLRAKSMQAAAIALAAAVGVGATVMLKSGLLPFMKAPAVAPPAPPAPLPAPVEHVAPRVHSGAPGAAVESAPVVEPLPSAPPAAADASKSRAQSVARRTAIPAEAKAPSQGDLPASDVDSPVGPEAEAALLGRAHQALSTSPANALALTEEHRHQYPAGTLGQESDLIAIEALVGLGRLDEARSAAARFRSRYPSSAHLRRIDRLLGDTESSGASPGR